MSTFKNNSKLGLEEIEIPNTDTLLEDLEEIIRVAKANIQQLISRDLVQKKDQQVVNARLHIADISKEINNIRRIYLQSEYQAVSPTVNSKHTNISVLLMKLKNSC
jgi:archaellum component FlaC